MCRDASQRSLRRSEFEDRLLEALGSSSSYFRASSNCADSLTVVSGVRGKGRKRLGSRKKSKSGAVKATDVSEDDSESESSDD
jgi:hypothetical protein